MAKLHFSIVSKLESKLHNGLVRSFKKGLELIINHTTTLGRSYLTPSDIDHVTNENYLDKIQASYEVERVYRANSLQQGFIYHYLNQGAIDDAYLVQIIWQYNSKLELNLLKEAWEYAQKQYPSLRLRLLWDEELLQVIDRKGVLDWRYIDLTKLKDAKEQELEINRIQENDRKERYILDQGNLFRIYMIKQRADSYVCIFSNHHAILDGWSNPILLKYVHDTYLDLINKKNIIITPDESYLEAQKYIQNSKAINESYWKERIGKIEEHIDLTSLILDKSKCQTLNEYRHIKTPKTKTFRIKEEEYKKLKRLSEEKGITLNAILQYVWHKVLAIYGSTNGDNVTTVVGTTISGRSLPINNLESSVGLYINTLPLVVEHKKNELVLEAISRVQKDILEMNSRSNSDLVSLQREGQRLFDTLFVYENYPVAAGSIDNRLKITFKEAIEKLDYPLAVIAYDRDKELSFSLKYAGELFEDEVIDRLLNTVNTILTQISSVLDNPKLSTQKLKYLDKKENDLILKKVECYR